MAFITTTFYLKFRFSTSVSAKIYKFFKNISLAVLNQLKCSGPQISNGRHDDKIWDVVVKFISVPNLKATLWK